jgi:hypothetical protein
MTCILTHHYDRNVSTMPWARENVIGQIRRLNIHFRSMADPLPSRPAAH